MSALHDRPTAAELVAAVREWLGGPVLSDGCPAGAYDVRVAAAALAVVERELARGPGERAPEVDHDAVAAAVRRGEPVPEAVRAAVLADVDAALRVSNPRYLEQ